MEKRRSLVRSYLWTGLFLSTSLQAQSIKWFAESPATLSATHHTYVAVVGDVKSTRLEKYDGDRHIILCDNGACATGECMKQLPCAKPKLGQRIKMWGISRNDPEFGRVPNHNKGEVHPLWGWAACRTKSCDEVQPK